MSTGLAIGALVLALAALGVAVAAALRTRRVLRALARELVELRGVLEREREGFAGAPAEAAAPGAGVGLVAERLDDLEARVRGLLQRSAVAVDRDAGGPADLRTRLTRALTARGYAQIVVLEEHGGSEALVEAEHDGVLEKGIARLAPDGRVAFEGVSSLRAFP